MTGRVDAAVGNCVATAGARQGVAFAVPVGCVDRGRGSIRAVPAGWRTDAAPAAQRSRPASTPKKPSRLGMRTRGSVVASIGSVSPTRPLANSRKAVSA